MKKRLTTLFLCLCLVFTMLPATALAGEEQTDGTGAEPGAGCICTGLCGEESVNKDCPVCGVEGIDLTVCQGEETQPDTPETLTEAPTDVTESSQEDLGTEDVIITDDSEGVETEGTEGTEETEETEAEEPASGCICTELCTGESVNGDCPVCGAGGADLTACKGVESQPDTQAKAAPARAITPRIAYDTLWIGNTRITDSGYWTTDGNGNLTASDAGNYNVAFDADTNTLSLNNATIVGSYDANNNPEGTGIYVGSRSGAVSLTIQVTGNNVVSGSYGIYALSNGGEVSVTISGGGSLTASGSQNGISIVSEFSNAALAIEGTAVKASGSYGEGVSVQAGESSTGSLSVDGGSLTASGNTGIEFWFSTGMSGSGTPSLTVAGNAVVDAKSGGIAHNSSNNLSIQGNSGIVFNGSTGTVYGNASLQEDLIIGEGESLTLDNGASLNANGHNVIVDGGTLDEGIKNSLGGSVKYTPTITTTSLPNGTAEAAYSTTLLAEGTAPITWSVTGGSLPEGLSLDASTGVISGTPTAEGVSTFTVTAANAYGSDSREFTLNIDKPVVIPVTGVKLDKTSLTLQETGSDTLTVTVEPDNATNKNVNWESSDTSIATVDASGKVIAISAGSATITATAADGSGKSASCSVTVTHGNMVHIPKKDATCTAEGNKEYWTCGTCGKIFSDAEGKTEIELSATVIPATGHTLTKTEEKAPTCTADGNKEYWTCGTCGKIFSDAEGKTEIELSATVIPATGHTLTKTEEKAPTCTADGNKEYWTCGTCGKIFSDAEGKTEIELSATVIPATGHTLTKTEEKAPTCTADGNKEYWTCGTCGKIFSDAEGKTEIELSATVIPATGHTLTKTEEKAPTCTADGNKEYWTCGTCGKIFSDAEGKTEIELSATVIPATGHTLTKTEEKAPTCTADGNKEYWTCGTCGKIFSDAEGKTEIALSDTVISKLGHSYGEPVWIWSEDGKSCIVTFTCANDDSHKETPEVKVSSKVKKAATCTEKGVTVYTATVEFHGKTFTDTKEVADIEQIAHNYKDGKCTVCGAADPDYQKPSKSDEKNTVSKEDNTAKAVQTGDMANPAVWILLLTASVLVFAGAVVFRKKKEN